MRIALVSPGFFPAIGGVETVVTEVATGLVARGHTVEVWAQDRSVSRPEVLHHRGVRVRRFPAHGPAKYSVSYALAKHVRANAADLDILHGHSYHAATFMASSPALHKVRLVLTPHFHGTGHTRFSRAAHPAYKQVARRLLAKADAIVTGSASEYALFCEAFPTAAPRTVKIVNAVGVQEIHAAQPLPNQPPIVLALGRVERYKRLDTLLQAWEHQTGPARLTIIGDGNDDRRIRGLAAVNSRRDTIDILGRLPRVEVIRWLRTASVAVCLSEHESFGIVAWEAAAAGAALLLSDIEPFREIQTLMPESRICLTSPKTPDVSENLSLLLDKPANVGPQLIRDWDSVVDEHEVLYKSVLHGPLS